MYWTIAWHWLKWGKVGKVRPLVSLLLSSQSWSYRLVLPTCLLALCLRWAIRNLSMALSSNAGPRIRSSSRSLRFVIITWNTKGYHLEQFHQPTDIQFPMWNCECTCIRRGRGGGSLLPQIFGSLKVWQNLGNKYFWYVIRYNNPYMCFHIGNAERILKEELSTENNSGQEPTIYSDLKCGQRPNISVPPIWTHPIRLRVELLWFLKKYAMQKSYG